MPQTSRRIAIELSSEQFELVERAAGRAGESPSQFVRAAAIRAARSVPPSAHDKALVGVNGAGPGVMPTRRSLRRLIHPPPVSTPDIARQLSRHLGRHLLAITVDAVGAEVDAWSSGEAEPSPSHERRLREAYEVWQFVMSVESIETTRAWWMGMKEQLSDLSPAEAIAADQASAVMSVARDFVEGG